MGVTDPMCEVSGQDATCAICDRPIRYVLGEPSLRKVTTNTTVYASIGCCMLEPCGQTFTVRRSGLIH
jgi:hypothetical protein